MKYRPEYNKKLIGKNLRRCRQAKKYTVQQVREYLKLGSIQAIYKWEEGASYPQTDTMFALMELYEIGLSDLLKEDDDQELLADGGEKGGVCLEYKDQKEHLEMNGGNKKRRLKVYFESLQNGVA